MRLDWCDSASAVSDEREPLSPYAVECTSARGTAKYQAKNQARSTLQMDSGRGAKPPSIKP
jgi:hypothetical protein